MINIVILVCANIIPVDLCIPEAAQHRMLITETPYTTMEECTDHAGRFLRGRLVVDPGFYAAIFCERRTRGEPET